jgi:hypothetical protein
MMNEVSYISKTFKISTTSLNMLRQIHLVHDFYHQDIIEMSLNIIHDIIKMPPETRKELTNIIVVPEFQEFVSKMNTK